MLQDYYHMQGYRKHVNYEQNDRINCKETAYHKSMA